MKQFIVTLGLGWCALLVSASCDRAGEAGKGQAVPDRFVVPADATVEELIAFVDALLDYKPATRGEMETYQLHGREAVLTASRRVLELEQNKQSANYAKAFYWKFHAELGSIAAKTPQQQTEWLAGIQVFFADKQTLDEGDANLAQQAAGALEEIGSAESLALAAEAYATFAKTFEGRSTLAPYFAGAHHRLTLVGKPFELVGTDLNGNAIDVTQWKDKVVLVDFWATRCRPCVAEIPNVLKLYEQYKDRGFVVIGVSLDEKLPDLESFVERNQIPWPTIAANIGDGNEAPAHYGVMKIPQMIVVGRDGKVVATGVRGEELTRIFAEQLGSP